MHHLGDTGDTEQPMLVLIHGGGVAGWMWDDVADSPPPIPASSGARP